MLRQGLVTVAIGVVAAGCGGGGGGGGGRTSGGLSTGLSASLPANTRSANGYDWTSQSVGTTPGGAISALAAAPVGTDVLALRTPPEEIVRISGTAVASEATFPDGGRAIATVGTDSYVATGDPATAGAGRVYIRSAAGTWSAILDSGAPEASVAASASGALALAGGEGLPGRVWRLAAATPTEIAALASATPVCAASYTDGLYVGCAGNAVGGDGAKLYRLSGSATTEVALPLGGGAQAGQRGRVTAILSIDAGAGVRLLALALGTFDIATGAGQGGWVLLGDGNGFEVLTSFGGEAPTCLAWHDSTLYVGTSGGRVQYRDSNGSWVDESGLPQNAGVRALLPRGSGGLLVGCASSSGPRLLVRSVRAAPAPPSGGGGNPPPSGGGGTVTPPAGAPPNPGRDIFFATDIKFMVQAQCVICHNDPNNTAAFRVYAVSRLPDDYASYQATKDKVDVTKDPAQSLLLRKITNQTPHTGGAQVQVNDATYTLVYYWILQGARLSAAGSAPPYNYFTEVKPTVDKGCYGCHFNGTGGYSLGGNYTENYNELLQELDLANPRNSIFIRKINGVTAHGGGVAFAPNSAEETKIVNWIIAGRPFQ